MIKDFQLKPDGPVSSMALSLGLESFRELCNHLLFLPYRRPFGKTSLDVIKEACGTCSSKHGVLKDVANEQNKFEIDLRLCMFTMNEHNTPAAADIFREGPLNELPEAHTYVQWEKEKIDVTKPGFHVEMLTGDILQEYSISRLELSNKVEFHRAYLTDWLKNKHPEVFLEEAWKQREKCIAALTKKDC